MRIDRETFLFFDASCLIAAAGSPSGGSGFLLSLCARGLLRAAVSQPVLLEAERNVMAKLDGRALAVYRRWLSLIPMVIAPVPSDAQRQRYHQTVNEKDEHVVVATIAVGAPFLLTLDQPLAEEVRRAKLPIRACSPGEFIKKMLPQHVDYSTLRE